MGAVYLDHNATTPLDPRVRDAMLPWLGEQWGNASSVHQFGQRARAAVEMARGQVARLIGAAPLEVLFTASGTEANNTVLQTALGAGGGGHLVVSALEHPSILGAAREWAPARGCELSVVSPGGDGVVSVERLVAALRPETRLVSLLLAHNEVGTIQPVAEVARLCRQRGVPLLCDAVQAVGKIPVDVQQLGVDYLTIAAHKFHGPLGAAALWVRPGAPFAAYLVGGAQERRRRAGTMNLPALAGFGRAAELATAELPARAAALARLRDRYEAGLAGIPGTRIHAAGAPRLPHTSHVAFPGLIGQELMIRLDLAGFAVSTGAACSSGSVEPSAALLAMGFSREEALASLRVSFGLGNRPEEVDAFLPVLAGEVAALRGAGVEARG